MYGGIGAGAAATATTGAVLALPNTGSNMIVNIAISVAVGILTWGIIYSRAAKTR